MTESDLAYLHRLSESQLAKAACYLNVGEWPRYLPADWREKYTRGEIRKAIENIVGPEAINDCWNTYQFYRGKEGRTIA